MSLQLNENKGILRKDKMSLQIWGNGSFEEISK